MIESKIKHFETLWEEAEALAVTANKELGLAELANSIRDLLDSYIGVDSKDEIGFLLKKKYLAEILFTLSTISARDNINVYAALKEELLINEISK